MDDVEVVEWSLDGVLADMASIHASMKDRQFAFILGAGASVSSGIPTGQTLAAKWLKDLHLRECLDDRSLDQWAGECGVADGVLTLDNAAEFYPQIFERRFEGDREAGYAELEVAMEGKLPSLGYSLLAEIIQHTRHKVVVTTNFDNLVADALAMHAHQSPLVVAHESLAGFVRPQMRRPLVAKIHRDLYLHPINDTLGVSTMEHGWKIALKRLFQYFTPVVVGYGGNDGSLMDMLMGLQPGDIAGRMIWCYRGNTRPPQKALDVLSKHNGILVRVPGFDQFMLQLAANLVNDFDVAAIAERTAELGRARASRYREQASSLRAISVVGTVAEKKAGEVLTESVRSGQSWWSWQLMAENEPDFAKRDKIFKEGMLAFPDSVDLAGTYATFLEVHAQEYAAADTAFRHALTLDPRNSLYLGRYASFLEDHHQDFDRAQELYIKAAEPDTAHSNSLAMYAMFLAKYRHNNSEADALFNRALKNDTSNSWVRARYAQFLDVHLNDKNAAEAMFEEAYALNPQSDWLNVVFAKFLLRKGVDSERPKFLFARALEISPQDTWVQDAYLEFIGAPPRLAQELDSDAAGGI
ncbi:hypothetical protein ABEH28_11965 [Pseudomonas sp. Ps21-P2]|uniref:hypothetical protein n=1 Tax=Pseudomonas sp. Ps21-P2 TaxID=3080331 RepID=UPI003209D5F5